MTPGETNFNFGEWITEWDNLSKVVTWMVGIISTVVNSPPVSSEQTKSLTNLSRFITIAAIVCLLFFTSKLKKRYHAKIWLISVFLSLFFLLGGWFLNNYWVCTFEDGKSFVMGYNRTPNGELQRDKVKCQGCEQLIHNCAQNHPEYIWTPESIESVRHLLIFIYFLMWAVGVLFVTSVIQTVKCLKQPDPRPEVSGTWEGKRPDEGLLILSLSPNPYLKGVSGVLKVKVGEDSVHLYRLSGSKFCREYLYFSTSKRTDNHYQMSIDTVWDKRALLSSLIKKKYVFLCELNKSDRKALTIKSGVRPRYWSVRRTNPQYLVQILTLWSKPDRDHS
jgi:hypothetical protein